MHSEPTLGEVSYGKIWSIAWPIIAGSAAQTVLNVTDTAFIGHLGAVPLGAGAIAGIIYLTLIMLAWGFGVGTQIVVARRYGEGRVRMVGRTVTHAFLFQWLMALLLFVLLRVWQGEVLGVLVRSEAVHAAAGRFLDFRLWGLFFSHTNFAFRAFYVGLGRTRVITLTTGIMVSVNALLDYLLIFGVGPFPAMGIEGAALASVIAEISCLVTFVTYTLLRGDWRHYRLFSFRVLSFRLLWRLVVVAIPVMLQNFFTMLGWLLFFVIVEKLGEAQLAVSNIIRSIMIVIQMPLMGYASATNTFVSYFMGRKEYQQVYGIIRKTLVLSVLSVGALAVVCLVFQDPVLSIYTDDAALIELAKPIMYIVAISSVMQAFGQMLFSGITGAGRTQVAFWIDISVLVLYVSLAWWIVAGLGLSLTWVWNVDWCYSLVLSIICLLYYRYGDWRGATV